MGRPPKPRTADALNPMLYAEVAAKLAYEHVKRESREHQRPQWVWADLVTELFDIAFTKLIYLCRRYDSRGTPYGYLMTFLPHQCGQPFDAATERALDESGHFSFDEVFADLL